MQKDTLKLMPTLKTHGGTYLRREDVTGRPFDVMEVELEEQRPRED